MKCAICQTHIGKGRNPGGALCRRCSGDANIPYRREEWELCAGDVVLHKFLECSFQIVRTGDGLIAKELRVANPDQVLQHDFDRLQELAVSAYLDLIDWDVPDRPQSRVEGKRPKPS